MEITVISPLNGSLQVWTLHMSEEEFTEAFEKYADRGCSVLVDQNEVADEIKEIYK